MWKGSYMSQRIQNNAKRKVIFIPLGKSKWNDTIEVRNFFFFAILMFHSTRKGTFWWKTFRKHLNMWRKGLAYELAFIGVEFEVTCWETGGIFKEKRKLLPFVIYPAIWRTFSTFGVSSCLNLLKISVF